MRIARLAALALLARPGSGCTVIGVGRDASVDGSVMVAHTDDSGGMGDPRLVRVPARDWPEGSTRNVFLSIADYPRMVAPERAEGYAPAAPSHASLPWAEPIGTIPQVPHTYAYWDVDYGLGNEHALVLAETTCSAKLRAAPVGMPNGTALFGIEELSKIALERCKTARCAVQTMGSLGERYGYYGGNAHLGKLAPWPGLGLGGEGEALAIGDATGEIWAFHILPGPSVSDGRGAIWAAQRMPPDGVFVIANMFIIRTLQLTRAHDSAQDSAPDSAPDSADFLASAEIEAVAQELGFWDPASGPLDFTAAFSGNSLVVDPTGRKQLVNRFYAGRRIWRVFDLLAPGLQLDADEGVFQERATYPLAVVPEAKVGLPTFFRLLRDHYEGTPYDLTVGPAAGPYGTPNRWGPGEGEREVAGGWERAISMHRSLFSFVAQARPDAIAPMQGVVWWGEDSPHASCFVPLLLAQPSFPAAFTNGSAADYDDRSAWWAFNVVKRTMDLNFESMQRDVAAAARACEANGIAALARAEAAAAAALEAATRRPPHRLRRSAELRDPLEAAAAAAGAETSEHAAWAVRAWRRLFGELMVRYKNGYRNLPLAEGVAREAGIGYPAWWLKLVGYNEWAARVTLRARAADARRADGAAPLPLEPARAPNASEVSRGAPGATPSAPGFDSPARAEAHSAPPRVLGMGERVGMAVCAVLGAALFFALGLFGGHRLDRIRRKHGRGTPHAQPLLAGGAPAEEAGGAGGSGGGNRTGRRNVPQAAV